jgi:hypothetical protein
VPLQPPPFQHTTPLLPTGGRVSISPSAFSLQPLAFPPFPFYSARRIPTGSARASRPSASAPSTTSWTSPTSS